SYTEPGTAQVELSSLLQPTKSLEYHPLNVNEPLGLQLAPFLKRPQSNLEDWSQTVVRVKWPFGKLFAAQNLELIDAPGFSTTDHPCFSKNVEKFLLSQHHLDGIIYLFN